MRSPFGTDKAYGWPAWSDMRPLLLRSAGVVGLAGMVIAVISNDTFMGSQEAPEPTPAVWHAPEEPEMSAAAATIQNGDAGSNGEAATLGGGANTPSAEEAQPAPAQPMRIAPLVFTAEPIVGRLERTVFTPSPASRPAAKPTPEAAPEQTASIAPAATPVEDPAEPTVAELVEPAEARQAEPTEAETSASSWARAAVECPRDWLGGGDQAAAPENCETIVALLPSAAAPEDLVALDEAAEEHAEQLAAVGPRMPRARPEPPPDAIKVIRKVSTSRRSDWPAAPPPDCGTKHAYWRFVDRTAGTKEWYCK